MQDLPYDIKYYILEFLPYYCLTHKNWLDYYTIITIKSTSTLLLYGDWDDFKEPVQSISNGQFKIYVKPALYKIAIKDTVDNKWLQLCPALGRTYDIIAKRDYISDKVINVLTITQNQNEKIDLTG